METIVDGQTYRFDKYAVPGGQEGVYYLNFLGNLIHAPDQISTALRACFKRVPKLHTFGGVVFEEIGHARQLKPGEFGVDPHKNTLVHQPDDRVFPYVYIPVKAVAFAD